jgi:hypothetical protein
VISCFCPRFSPCHDLPFNRLTSVPRLSWGDFLFLPKVFSLSVCFFTGLSPVNCFCPRFSPCLFVFLPGCLPLIVFSKVVSLSVCFLSDCLPLIVFSKVVSLSVCFLPGCLPLIVFFFFFFSQSQRPKSTIKVKADVALGLTCCVQGVPRISRNKDYLILVTNQNLI